MVGAGGGRVVGGQEGGGFFGGVSRGWAVWGSGRGASRDLLGG